MGSHQVNNSETRISGARGILFLVLFVVLMIAISLVVFNAAKAFVVNAPIDVLGEGGLPEGEIEGGEETGLTEEELANVRWDEGKVTLLLMGIDEREFETGPARTDTIILLTIDPETMRAGMVSVPRDLWVEIPNYQVYDKVNTAYFRGETDQYPGGGGVALAADTIQHNLGIDINYYATVNFQAFVGIIDQIGCIPIEVPQTIDDPDYPAADGYGVDPFYLEAGEYCMGGETLLKYARTRTTFGGDFDRSARQQQVINAVREYVLGSGQLGSFIAKAPQIYATVSDGIQTDMDLQQGIALALLATEIPSEDICSVVVDGKYVDLQKLPDGTEVLIPVRESIRALLSDLWNGTGICAPDYVEGETPIAEETASTPSGDQPTPAPTGEGDEEPVEGMTIAVLNGTGTAGLASTAASTLEANGYEVTYIGNSDLLYEETVVFSYSGYDVEAIGVGSVLGIPPSAIQAGTGGRYDIEIILGADYLDEEE